MPKRGEEWISRGGVVFFGSREEGQMFLKGGKKMEERRKFRRWYPEGGEKVIVVQAGSSQEMALLDISPGGMKFSCSTALAVGLTIEARVDVLPGAGPFYVRGCVCRTQQRNDLWEIAVTFQKIRTYSLSS